MARPTLSELPDQLDRWVARGLITSEQAQRILDEEQEAGGGRSVPLVIEALGYVGGILVLVAAGTITGRYWSALGVSGRLSLACAAAAVLLIIGIGAAQRSGAAGLRLRSVCWLLSAATFAAALALLGGEVLELRGDSVVLLAAGVTAVYAGALWARTRGVLQQAALVAALAVAAAAASAHLPGDDAVSGLAVWGTGAVWLLLGWGGLVTPRTAAFVLGGAAAVVGPGLALEAGWGTGVAIGSAVVLLAAGMWLRDLVLLAAGSVATLWTVPVVLDRFFPGSLTAPLALLAAGVTLLVTALVIAPSVARSRPGTQRSPRSGSPRLAVGLAGGLAVLVTVAVVTVGLVT